MLRMVMRKPLRMLTGVLTRRCSSLLIEATSRHADAQGADQDEVEQGHGNEELPAQTHQLVDAQPRQRGADPEQDEDQAERLGEEPDQGENAVLPAQQRQPMGERAVPAAEEKRDEDRRLDEGVEWKS